MQLADDSLSLLWISARVRMTEAQGVPERIKMLYLRTGSTGRKYTRANENSGNTRSFIKQMKYTNGVVKSFFGSIAESLIPRIIIHTGVVIVPRRLIDVTAWVGRYL